MEFYWKYCNNSLDVINDCIKGLPISLLGASYNGVSVNDCIANSLLEVNKILQSF